MESRLRQDCQTLLKQLQTSQHLLNKEIDEHAKADIIMSVSGNLSTNETTQPLKSAYARSRLYNSARINSADNGNANSTIYNRSDFVKNKENIYDGFADYIVRQEARVMQGLSKLSIQTDNSLGSQSRPDTVPYDRAVPHDRAAPHDRAVPHDRAAPHDRDVPLKSAVPHGSAAPHVSAAPHDRAVPHDSAAPHDRAVPHDRCKEHLRAAADDEEQVISSSWQSATPNTQRRRMIIDRHTHVPTKLDQKELRDLNNERKLNFSYSHVSSDEDVRNGEDVRNHANNDSELCDNFEDQVTISESNEKINHLLLPVTHANSREDLGKNKEVKSGSLQRNATNESKSYTRNDQQTFKENLEADGNNRKLNTFVRDTTSKPKSLLNSTTYSLHNLSASRRNNSSARFDASRTTQDLLPDQRLLGYDWIAALLDNDSELVDQSESFFNELKDFRKAYKDECSNRFYMEGPHMLVDLEPEILAEATGEPKVEPYVVNERLFTVPLKSRLVDYEDDDDVSIPANSRSKKPTAGSPRFVRVSIPRSTLQAPYRVRPHRRRSFDASDSCSLRDHCLLGWENAVPSMLPTAKSVDLNTAAGTCRDYQKLTLAEAEKVAHTSSRPKWAFDKPNARLWKQQYADSSQTIPGAASTNSSSSRALGEGSTKRATDKLLNSAYLTMYEMERLKEQRRLENLRKGEKT